MTPMSALEVAELRAFESVYHSATEPDTAACGLTTSRIDDGLLIAANKIDVLALNRVLGLGLERDISHETLQRVIAAFKTAGSPRFFLSLAPVAEHEQIGARIEAAGLRHYNNWMRLQFDLRQLKDEPPSSGAVTVREIGRDDAAAFGRIVAEGFGYPPPLAPLPTRVIGRPSWRHYLAYENDTPIGAAARCIADEAAWFGFAATDAAHRRKGAQHALVIRRLHDAAAAGCKWVSVETAEDTVTRDAPSFRNLRRLGFSIAYKRPNYLWTSA